MENFGNNYSPEKKFSSPEEELNYLRNIVNQKENNLEKDLDKQIFDDRITEGVIRDYSKNEPEDVLEKGQNIPEKFRDEIVLDLKPEEHDDKMAELVSILETKGISNTLSIVQKLNDPHISDDFHRFLVQYLKSGHPLKGVKDNGPIYKNLKRTLFEVVLADFRGQTDETLEDLFHKMQQFYSGMISIGEGSKDDYLSIEIANAIGSREFIFYISVSDKNIDLFEKQILSIFPDARIEEKKDDFNIFNQKGSSVGSHAKLNSFAAKPIKTYEEFKNDPLKVILNVFSKLNQHDEAAAIQFIFKPVGDFYLKNYSKGLSKIEKGEKGADEFHVSNTAGDKFKHSLTGFIEGFSSGGNKEQDEKPKEIDSTLIEQVKNKISAPIVSSNIRIITSAANNARAKDIMREIQSSFNQFENTTGNSFKFSEIKEKHQTDIFQKFSYRQFDKNTDIPLNLKECATLFHLPSEQKNISSQLKTSKSKSASVPIDMATEGILLGVNKHQNQETEIRFSPEDRMRHFYVIGQTGTGKTTILKNMIIQDIQNGDGVCMIDPHGSDIQDVLANVPPERQDDVIYFDPAYTKRPMALNMLEFDRDYPEQKTFVVNELFSIFQKLYGGVPESMGPMFEQYFRNATMLVIEDPDSGCTLLDVSRVMSDKAFRDMKIANCKNPIVVQFWTEIAEKAGGEASLANIVPYITSKFDVFLANDIMRPVISQEKSSFNFREIMDNKKILLVNLSKGRLGDINSSLIGLIIVGKILMAALSRVDSLGKELAPFYLYIDEFQNVTTPSIATILSEARKYKLSLNIAHQYIEQLDDKIKDAVFGNVGSMATYRVGSDDSKFLESQFAPIFEAKDIMNLDNFNSYIKMLSNGIPQRPFSMKAFPSPFGNPDIANSLMELSYLKYGQDRDIVESDIMAKYKKAPLVQKKDIDLSKFNI